MPREYVVILASSFIMGSLLIGLVPAAEAEVVPLDAHVVILDEDGSPRNIDELNVTSDTGNRTFSISAADSTDRPFWVYVNESWTQSIVPHPAFVNASYVRKLHDGATWFGVRVGKPTEGSAFLVQEFRPELDRPAYSVGSPASISLERPMFVSLEEVPRVELRPVTKSNENGTWTEDEAVPVFRMGINFTDEDRGGQTVSLSRAWLGTYGLTGPYFQYEDGTPVENASDPSSFLLYPTHFSVLYVFTTNEAFTKESNQQYSDLYWDSVNRNIYMLSDRRDPAQTNERMVSPSPVVYDETTSFTVRATWKTTQQGHWQWAVPVFFIGSSNTKVHMANSVYILYVSRNQGGPCSYYFRYLDSTGTLRVETPVDNIAANVQLEFLLDYNGYTRTLYFAIYDSLGSILGSRSYVLGSGEKFALGEVGAAAWGAGLPPPAEPAAIATVDNIFFDANMARNGNYEVDADGNNVPDNWQMWIWSDGPVYRSSDRAKFGTWSAKITDSSSTADYGLQTVYIAASAGKTFTGTTWVWAVSGSYWLCIEFWDSSGYTRLSVACKASVTTATWEFLDLTMTAPSLAAKVDLLVYSTGSNTGTGYFDGAELRPQRSFWSITIHTDHVSDLTLWSRALDYVGDLGVTHVRTDLAWEWFEPTQGSYDSDVISFWSSVIQLTRSKGMGFTAILDHFPTWAHQLYLDGQKDTVFAAWHAFARLVATQYGSSIYFYQLLNEENHFAHSELDHSDEPRGFQEAYNGLLEGENLDAPSHKSGLKTIVNIWADDLGPGGNDWDTYFRDILGDSRSGPSIDIVAIDHYPGTWCCGSNYRDWAALDGLLTIARDFEKEMAVMETGFTTYGFNPLGNQHNQPDQEAFVDQGMDQVLLRRNSYASTDPSIAFLLLSWYEFIDVCSNCGGWPLVENHWGILTYADGVWGLKLAYDNLRYQVSRWT